MSNIADKLQRQQTGAPRPKMRGDQNGISWQQSGKAMPYSSFATVVAPPTVPGIGDGTQTPTEAEMRRFLGREPDEYEKPSTQGIGFMHLLTGAIEQVTDPETRVTTTRQLATHLYVAPEKRAGMLLRIPDLSERAMHLAIQTALDSHQEADYDALIDVLSNSPYYKRFDALIVTDEKLKKIGLMGTIQDGMVRCGSSEWNPLTKPVAIDQYFENVLDEIEAEGQVDVGDAMAGGIPQQVAPAPEAALPKETPIAKEEPGEMKTPEQTTPFKCQLPGMTKRGKCAYIKVQDDLVLLANALGSDCDEFDTTVDVVLSSGDINVKCRAMAAAFELPEAGVYLQVFKVVK